MMIALIRLIGRVDRIIINSVVLILGLTINGTAQNVASLHGCIKDSTTQLPLEMAFVVFPELNNWSYTDHTGAFVFNNIPSGRHNIKIQLLGYITHISNIVVDSNTVLSINLNADNLQLKEVVVTATEKHSNGTTSIINQQSMQHIQPSGFYDLLELLPGSVSHKSDMSKVSGIALRQVGNDNNTALGTAFYIDGMSLNNDAGLQYNANSSGDLKISDRVNSANGMDMRQISTDDIESVEIVRGIPSVRYGDLSHGAVLITRKWGYTPVNARAKSDLNNKLFSLGKGFRLPNENGVVNFATELLLFKSDPRNPLENYTRSTTSLRYVRQVNWENAKLNVKSGLAYLFTLDKEKTDPDINNGQKDFYKSDFSKLTFDLSGDLQFAGNNSKQLSFKFSAANAVDHLVRERYVSPTGPMPQPVSMIAGKADASYLPQGYDAALIIDGKPVNIFSQLNFMVTIPSNRVGQTINSGFEWRMDKNYGDGEIYDLSLPPFPATGSGRPRSFLDIPALHKAFLYVEDNLLIKLQKHQFDIKPGFRVSALPGINSQYALNGKAFVDPRVNISWQLPDLYVNNHNKLDVSIHAGYGKMTRLPVLAHFYPDLRYFDIIELNYYSQNEALRRLYVMTQIENPTNYHLMPSVNIKKEIGLSLAFNRTKLTMTLFDEQMDNGFISLPQYVSYTYNSYNASSVSSTGLTSPPDLSTFEYNTISRLYSYDRFVNGQSIHKQGLEYQLFFPRINPLHTKVSVDGAWFKSRYDLSVPDYYKPSYIINNDIYPYVGIYDYSSSGSYQKESLITNIQVDVHLPDFRLLFSMSAQTVWFVNTRYRSFNGIPNGYLDNDGIYHAFNPEDVNDALLKYLVMTFSDKYFQTDKVAINTGVNLKLSKEIGDAMRFSFYVNRMLNYLPDYQSRYGTTITRKQSPYFGMEINLTF